MKTAAIIAILSLFAVIFVACTQAPVETTGQNTVGDAGASLDSQFDSYSDSSSSMADSVNDQDLAAVATP